MVAAGDRDSRLWHSTGSSLIAVDFYFDDDDDIAVAVTVFLIVISG